MCELLRLFAHVAGHLYSTSSLILRELPPGPRHEALHLGRRAEHRHVHVLQHVLGDEATRHVVDLSGDAGEAWRG